MEGQSPGADGILGVSHGDCLAGILGGGDEMKINKNIISDICGAVLLIGSIVGCVSLINYAVTR